MKTSRAALIVSVGALALFMTAMSLANWTGCAWYGYQTDRTTRYAFGIGCMVEMTTGWTPRSELRTEQ